MRARGQQSTGGPELQRCGEWQAAKLDGVQVHLQEDVERGKRKRGYGPRRT